jgi:hypothetical protein
MIGLFWWKSHKFMSIRLPDLHGRLRVHVHVWQIANKVRMNYQKFQFLRLNTRVSLYDDGILQRKFKKKKKKLNHNKNVERKQ